MTGRERGLGLDLELNGTCDMGGEPLLIDEWQRLPAFWDAVQRAVDQNTRADEVAVIPLALLGA